MTAAGSPARYALLSAAAAAATMALKFAAWHLSGSIGLLSDAFESFVNLGASLVAFLSLRWAEQPPDDDHVYRSEERRVGKESVVRVDLGGRGIMKKKTDINKSGVTH